MQFDRHNINSFKGKVTDWPDLTFDHSNVRYKSHVNKECKMLSLVVEHLNLFWALFIVNMMPLTVLFVARTTELEPQRWSVSFKATRKNKTKRTNHVNLTILKVHVRHQHTFNTKAWYRSVCSSAEIAALPTTCGRGDITPRITPYPTGNF